LKQIASNIAEIENCIFIDIAH